jgi:hypothetical protein
MMPKGPIQRKRSADAVIGRRTAAAWLCSTVLVCSACSDNAPSSNKQNSAANETTASGPVNAAMAAPLHGMCKDVPLNKDAWLERRGPIQIPAQLNHLAASSLTSLTVAGEGQRPPICIDISWYEDVQNIALLTPDQRFLGFDGIGNESGGYVVIDRRGEPQEIETGTTPLFSPSGRLFASAEWSESGFGNFNDIGIWEITDGGTKRLFNIPEAQSAIFSDTGDWRVEKWKGENCVLLSMVRSDLTRPEAEQRGYVQLKIYKGEWRLSRTTAALGCAVKR